jgi:5'-nucleotidase
MSRMTQNGERSSNRKFNVLISNDDGVSAPGLRALVGELALNGDLALYVCGPFGERSGQSNAITIGGRGPLHAFQIPSIGGVIDSYAVDGTPADSIIIACRTNLVVEDPTNTFDLVVSGINRGDNSGIHVVYSGTCGAAREANHHGLPAIAFSLDDHNARSEASYVRAAKIAAALVRQTLETIDEHKEAFCRTLINVNVPGEEAFEGLHMCRQGRHSSTSELVEVDVEDDFHVRNAHKDTEICLHGVRDKKALRAFRHMNFRHVDDQTQHTDFALLSENWATVTVLDSLMDVPLRPEHFASRYDETHIGLVRGIVKRAGVQLQCPARDDQGAAL